MTQNPSTLSQFSSSDYCVIYNPFSGGRSKDRMLRKIESGLLPFRCLIASTSLEHGALNAIEKARRAGIHQFIAVGGDGTVQSVATNLDRESEVLGLVMAGSGNGFAAHFGYQRNLSQNLDIIRKGRRQQIDQVSVNGHRFVNLAGVGFDARVADLVRSSKQRGFLAYLKAVGQLMFTDIFWTGQVYLDKEQVEGEFLTVVVANASIFGYGFSIAKGAQADDGLMTVVLVERVARIRYLLALPFFFLGQAHRLSWIKVRTVSRVQIKPDDLTPVQTDGELLMAVMTYDFQIEPRSLTLITA